MERMTLVLLLALLAAPAAAQEAATARGTAQSAGEATSAAVKIAQMQAQLQAVERETLRRLNCQRQTMVSTADGCVEVPGLREFVEQKLEAEGSGFGGQGSGGGTWWR